MRTSDAVSSAPRPATTRRAWRWRQRSTASAPSLHGTIWDEANEKAKELVRTEGLTYVHPFDDEQLIAGQGTLGLEVVQDWPELEAVIVPIGGGGLIAGVSMAVKG